MDSHFHIISAYETEFEKALAAGQFDKGNIWTEFGTQMGMASFHIQ